MFSCKIMLYCSKQLYCTCLLYPIKWGRLLSARAKKLNKRNKFPLDYGCDLLKVHHNNNWNLLRARIQNSSISRSEYEIGKGSMLFWFSLYCMVIKRKKKLYFSLIYVFFFYSFLRWWFWCNLGFVFRRKKKWFMP